jgi:hypothetical protein
MMKHIVLHSGVQGLTMGTCSDHSKIQNRTRNVFQPCHPATPAYHQSLVKHLLGATSPLLQAHVIAQLGPVLDEGWGAAFQLRRACVSGDTLGLKWH